MPTVKKLRGGLSKRRSVVRSDDDGDSISLPEKPNRVSDSLFDFCIVVFGLKGIGKTSLAAALTRRASITYMLERRRRNLRIRQVPDPNRNEEQLDCTRLRKYFRLQAKLYGLKKPGRDEEGAATTAVIDTADRFYDLHYKEVCEERGLSDPNAAKDFGGTWTEIMDRVRDSIDVLFDAEIMPIFISHAKLKPIQATTPEAEQFEQYLPSCTKSMFGYLEEVADVAIFYGKYKLQRFLTVDGNDMLWRSSGVEGHFLDRKGKPIAMIPAGDSARQAARNLEAAFINDPPKGSITVEEYKRLAAEANGEEPEEDDDSEDESVALPEARPHKKKKRRVTE